MSNTEFQALGKVSRVVEVYLLDCFKERIQRLPIDPERYSKYPKEDLEVIRNKVLTTSEVLLQSDPCPY